MNTKIAALLLLALCAQPAWSQSYAYSSTHPPPPNPPNPLQ